MKEPKTRADLARMIPNGGTIIELGVAAGLFAEQMLAANPTANYIGIDRWSDHHDDAEMMTARIRLRPFGQRAITIRATFDAAVPTFRNTRADLIYVDGYAHTGQDNGRTLSDWWPMVGRGGIFAGHDYDPISYPQTVRAVDGFVAEIGPDHELGIIDELPHSSWWIRKPNA